MDETNRNKKKLMKIKKQRNKTKIKKKKQPLSKKESEIMDSTPEDSEKLIEVTVPSEPLDDNEEKSPELKLDSKRTKRKKKQPLREKKSKIMDSTKEDSEKPIEETVPSELLDDKEEKSPELILDSKRTKRKKRQPLSEKKSEILDSTPEDSEKPIEETVPSEPSDDREVKSSELILDSKRTKRGTVQRSEASQNVSEFNLNEVGKERVQINDLIKETMKLVNEKGVRKQLHSAKKLKSLPVPLSKPQLDKISRTVAYGKVCNELDKWNSTVKNNRAAPETTFPLKKPFVYKDNFEHTEESCVIKHPVTKAQEEILNSSTSQRKSDKELSVDEEKALQTMSLQEAKLRHSELMKHKALISYQEAKARRQNKIKSKRYHRILKREKLKNIMKDFEALEKVDAAAAVEKLMEADNVRILERMTLKHRNTGKWAKLQKIRAKYNPEARSNLKEDLVIGRTFKEKLPSVQQKIQELKASMELPEELEDEDGNMYDNGLLEGTEEDVAMQDQSHSEVMPAASEESQEESNKSSKQFNKPKSQETTATSDFAELDLTLLKSYGSKQASAGDDHIDDLYSEEDSDAEEDDNVKNVREAFADEELIAEFREEKKAVEKAKQPKGIDTYLPGWGSWGGPMIKDSNKKKKKYFIRTELPPHKGNTVGYVILNESRSKVAAHQVKELPFPFNNVTQYERHIRQPLGHTWNPQNSFQKLTTPKITTKAGKIIEPIDAEDAVLNKGVI